MTRSMFLPVMRCANPRCASMFVGVGTHCATCAARVANQSRKMKAIANGAASKRDMREHKRLSLRKRLGLLA
jgi:hypothetical protein